MRRGLPHNRISVDPGYREEIQKNLESIPVIGFDTAVVLQAELWALKRFKDKDHLNSYVGLAPHLVGSGEHEEVRSAGNRKKKQLHYLRKNELLFQLQKKRPEIDPYLNFETLSWQYRPFEKEHKKGNPILMYFIRVPE